MSVSPTPKPSLGPGDEGLTGVLILGVILGSFFSIAAMQVLLGLAVLNWGWGVRRAGISGVRAPLALPLAGSVAISVLSALHSGNGHAIKESLSGGLPFLGFLVALNVLSRREWLARSVRFVVAGGALAAILGLLQAAFETRGIRISGSLSHYMTFAGLLMLAATVAVGRLVIGARGRERTVLLVAFLAIGVALLFSQTRGAWLGLAAGSIVALALRRWHLLPLVPVVATAAYLLAPPHLQGRILSTFDPYDRTVMERAAMWRVGAAMIADHPLLGVGTRLTDEYYNEFAEADDPYADNPPGHLHSNLVQTAAERGVFALLLWLALWIAWFYRAGRIWKGLDEHDDLGRAAVAGSLAAMTAFHLMGCFEYNAGDSEVVTLAFLLAAWPFAVEGTRSGEVQE